MDSAYSLLEFNIGDPREETALIYGWDTHYADGSSYSQVTFKFFNERAVYYYFMRKQCTNAAGTNESYPIAWCLK
jgi:hypothetical protein